MPLLLPVLAFSIPWWWKRNRAGSWMALLSLALSGIITSYDFKINPGPVPAGANLRVMSMNVHFFDFTHDKAEAVAALVKQYNPDIVCFQEFRNKHVFPGQSTLEFFQEETGLAYGQFATAENHIHGVAILSRYPLLQTDTLFTLKDQTNSGMLAILDTPEGKIQVASVHLSSFQVIRVLDPDRTLEQRSRYLYDRFQRITMRQQSQISSILNDTRRNPFPTIICGDFNATAHSRIMHPLFSLFQDSFQEAGHGLGYTYPLMAGFGLRIDYALSSEACTPLNHTVLSEKISDHQPILVSYRLATHP